MLSNSILKKSKRRFYPYNTAHFHCNPRFRVVGFYRPDPFRTRYRKKFQNERSGGVGPTSATFLTRVIHINSHFLAVSLLFSQHSPLLLHQQHLFLLLISSLSMASVDPTAASASGRKPAEKWPGWPGQNAFRLIVPGSAVGSIIGREGKIIKRISEGTGARIHVISLPAGTTDCIVSLLSLSISRYLP